MNHRPSFFVTLLALVASTSGCACIQTLILKSVKGKDILTQLNTPASTEEPPFWPVDREVDEIMRDNLADAYWDAAGTLALLQQPTAPGKIREAIACMERASNNLAASGCQEALYDALAFPPAPSTLSEDAWRRELDVVRLQENLALGVRAASAWYRTSRPGPIESDAAAIEQGVTQGINGVIAYLKARPVARRRERPVSALVMSGGSANGAFSAGAAWYLLSRLDACKTAAEQVLKTDCGGNAECVAAQKKAASDSSCLKDQVDMVAGASTGSLITVLVKDYFATQENRRKRAIDMLTQSYTCSVNSDLYCVNDASLYDLTSGSTRGLVRFDGIEKKLDGYVDEGTFKAPPEYIASMVDYNTGRILHESSADPADITTVADLRLAVLASIVEPGMAEPVTHVGRFKGTLVDGGVRSGLPMATPLHRGAERAVVFVNSPIEAIPLASDPPNAGAILLRTLDLFTKQPVVGELHGAEFELVTKRVAEYERCLDRDRAVQAGWSTPHPSLEDLCSNQAWPGPAAPSGKQVVTQPGQPLVKSVPNAYQGLWLFMPTTLPKELEQLAPGTTWKTLSQAGYQFDPKAMWNLFVLGALQAQQNCPLLNSVLGWHLAAGGYCGDVTSLAQALQPMRDDASARCWTRKDELRMCK